MKKLLRKIKILLQTRMDSTCERAWDIRLDLNPGEKCFTLTFLWWKLYLLSELYMAVYRIDRLREKRERKRWELEDHISAAYGDSQTRN